MVFNKDTQEAGTELATHGSRIELVNQMPKVLLHKSSIWCQYHSSSRERSSEVHVDIFIQVLKHL